MTDLTVTRMWSDDELDATLAALHAQTPDGSTALATARVRLLAAATGGPPRPALPARAAQPDGRSPQPATETARATSDLPATPDPTATPDLPATPDPTATPDLPATPDETARRRRRRGLRIAAALSIAAVLVAVALIVPSFITERGRPVNSAEAVDVLNRAAVAALGAVDEPVGPGQYRFIETHAWWTVFSGYQVFREENVIRIWVPADPDDPAQQWMLDRRPTGNRVWIVGNEQEATEDGTYTDPVESGIVLRTTAPCGNFYRPGHCPRTDGVWQDPTPEFTTGLPRDPAQLYARLQADAPVNDRGSAELFVYAADALRTGLVPADLRAALYQALTRVDGIELTERAVNLDGRVGTAIGIDDGQFRHDIIVDPATGVFIGEREVLTDDLEGAPEGTTMQYTAVTTDVVDAIGALPTR